MNLHVDSLVDGKFSKSTKGIIILIFLIVPFISSVVSMIHVVRFLGLGNTDAISIVLAITYEIANLTILMAVVLMKKLRAVFVWLCFTVLLIVQIIGNVYYSYDYILQNITADPKYLDTFISFIQQMIELEDRRFVVFILSCFLGLPIPMVSLLLVKSVVDYLELEGQEKEEVVKEIEKEIVAPITKVVEVIEKKEPEPVVEKKVMEETASISEEVQAHLNTVEVESQPEVIHTEETAPTHIGVIIRPEDDNKN